MPQTNILKVNDKIFNELFCDGIGEYVTIVAEEDGVTIIGLTRGKDTRFHHTEKLDKGEVYIAQFTELSLIHI